MNVGDHVRHKKWFRGVYKGWVGIIKHIKDNGEIVVSFDGDPIPEKRVYDAHELEVTTEELTKDATSH